MIKRNIQTILLFLIVVFLISLVSCDPSKKYVEEERAQIQDYLMKNPNLNFELKSSGLYYMEVVAGSGNQVVLHDTAYIKYTNKLLSGDTLDTNVGTTNVFISPVDQAWLIAGVAEGLTYMSEGGKAVFLLPSKLAYGASGLQYGYYTFVPGYTPLLFEVELLKVVPGPVK